MSFTEIKTPFLAHLDARHAATTVAVEKVRWERIASHFSSDALRDVDAGRVGDFLTELRVTDGLSAASLNRHAALLSVVFRFAVERGFAARNPVTGLTRPKEDRRPVPFISEEDVSRLVAAASDPAYGVFLRVLSDTGLRRGEALALTWRDVSLKAKRAEITVRHSKTHEPRVVPLTAPARAALADQQARNTIIPLTGWDPVWPDLAKITPASVSGRFQTVAKRAGLEGLRLHDLRHGFCSRAKEAGVALPTIAALAGHKTITTTMRYARHAPEGSLRTAISRMEAAGREPDSVHERGPEGGPTETVLRKSGT